MRMRLAGPLFVLLSLFLVLPHPASCHAHGHNHGKGQHGQPKTSDEKSDIIANASSVYTGATARSLPLRPFSSLPSAFDWCDVDGVSYCTASWNQHIPKYGQRHHTQPQPSPPPSPAARDLTPVSSPCPRLSQSVLQELCYSALFAHVPACSLSSFLLPCVCVWQCGSCWVHGALAAANDRIKVLMDGRHDVMLARQVMLNCGASKGLGAGCDGGESFDVFEFMKRYGLPDESCANYMAEATESCDASAICSNCMPIGEDVFPYKCWAVPSPILYYVHSYGQVHGEQAMMTEIIERGPITCGFASIDDFDYNYRGGVYIDSTNATEMNHDVEVVGWGEVDGVKFWRARNSWGTYWGENGFFRIARGVNNMQFESDCVYALFDVHHVEDVLRGKMGGSMFGVVEQRDKFLNLSKKQPHVKDDRSSHSSKTRHHSGRDHDREGGRHKEEVERVTRGHFGGEPTPSHRLSEEQLNAIDAATVLDEYHYTYTHHHTDDGQTEVDTHTRERESYHKGQPSQVHHSHSSIHQRSPSAHARPRPDDLYSLALSDDSLSKDEEEEQEAIMQAVRVAYSHEQTRKRQPSTAQPSAKETSANLVRERHERLQDEAAIAAAIHHALRHSSSRAHVKQMVLHALNTLEKEAHDASGLAEGQGADASAEQQTRDRDVAIVEDEVGRAWRQQQVNATVDELDEAIGRVVARVKEGGKRIVEDIEGTGDREDDQVDVREVGELGMKGRRKPFDSQAQVEGLGKTGKEEGTMMVVGLMLGAVVGGLLGAVICGALVFVFFKLKERQDYDEL